MTTATLSKSKQKQLDQDYAIERLQEFYLSEGATVYTVIRSVSSSGMSRTMSLYVSKNSKIENITYYAAHALGWPLVEVNGSRALRVGGAGMDMGFHTVYTLSSVLFKGQERAGYALKHEWL